MEQHANGVQGQDGEDLCGAVLSSMSGLTFPTTWHKEDSAYLGYNNTRWLNNNVKLYPQLWHVGSPGFWCWLVGD